MAGLTIDLESIYREHRQGLFSLAMSITGCRQAAEDAVHDAFTRLYKRRPEPQQLTAYVFRTVRNVAIDHQRSGAKQRQAAESIFNGYVPPPAKTEAPPDDLLTSERDQILRCAIAALTEDERDAVVLRAFAGLTFDQAGEALDAPAKTVATRYRRALTKLENSLRGRL